MKKSKHYSLENILKCDADYMFLYGERSNGKSYAVKLRALERSYKNDEKFVYIRRWREDISSGRAERYWDDMVEDDEGNRRIEEITNGEYYFLSYYRNTLYFSNKDEKGKVIRGKEAGRVAVLTGDTHEKSAAFVGYFRIILEEAITKSGYLGDEVNTFMSLVSTILRRKKGEVFLIGNTLTKACPYFREWQLTNVPKQKIGTIDIYKHYSGQVDENGDAVTIKIAVEYCENSAGITKMIFGNKMITSGEWETDSFNHLPKKYGEYRKLCQVLILDELEIFAIDILSENRLPFLFIRTVDKRWIDKEKYNIVITDSFAHDARYMKNLSFTKLGKLCKRLFDSGNVCYQDNLVGTSFTTILNNRKIF